MTLVTTKARLRHKKSSFFFSSLLKISQKHKMISKCFLLPYATQLQTLFQFLMFFQSQHGLLQYLQYFKETVLFSALIGFIHELFNMTYMNPLCPPVCRLNIILQTDLISSVYYKKMTENASNMFSVDDKRSTSKGQLNLSSVP